MASSTPAHIAGSSDPTVPLLWDTAISDVGASVLENPFGAMSTEIMVSGVLSWVHTLELFSPDELAQPTLASSYYSLLQSRKPDIFPERRFFFFFSEEIFAPPP